MPVAQGNPSRPPSIPPSPKQGLQESRSHSGVSALLPAPSYSHAESNKDAAAVAIGTITNAYFTTASESRPGSGWSAAHLASTYSLSHTLPAATLAAVSAAPGSILFDHNSLPGAADANIGNAWLPCPPATNLWQQQTPTAPEADPVSPSGLSSPFGAFADKRPTLDYTALGMLGSKRSNSTPAQGGARGDGGAGFGTQGLFGDGLVSSAASSASSKRHKTGHMSPSSVKPDADSPMQSTRQVQHDGNQQSNRSSHMGRQGVQPVDDEGEGQRVGTTEADEQSRRDKHSRKNKAACKSPPRYHFNRQADVLGIVLLGNWEKLTLYANSNACCLAALNTKQSALVHTAVNRKLLLTLLSAQFQVYSTDLHEEQQQEQ